MANVDRLETIAQKLEAKAGISSPLSDRRDTTAEAKLRRIAVALAALDLADPNAITDAPSDGAQYARQSGSWATVVTATAATTTWGSITGTLTNQTDLASALSNKAALSHSHTEADITDLGTYIAAGSSITRLGDVGGSAPTTGQVPAWNATNTQYEPSTPAAGGGGGSFALKWEGLAGFASYSANGLVSNSLTIPADTVTDGDFIRITVSGRGGSGATNGQDIYLALPGEPYVHLLRDLSTSGQDWWCDLLLKVDSVSGPNMKLDYILQEHEDSEAHTGASNLDESSFSSGTGDVTDVDFTSSGEIGISIGDYSSGGGWVSFLRVQILTPGEYDGS